MIEKRIASIDFLRGIASLSVCFFHFTNGNPDYLSADNLLKWLGGYGWLGVYVFFVISGFIIPYTLYQNNYVLHQFGKFLLKRIIRIEIPYLVSIALVLISGYSVALYKAEIFEINWLNVFLHLFYLNIFVGYDWLLPVYWTLAIEFQYYLLIGLLFPLIISANLLIRYGIIASLLASSFLIKETQFIFHYLPLFLLGIATFQYKTGLISKKLFFLFASFLLFLIYCQFDFISLAVIFLTLLFMLFYHSELFFSIFFGKISYSLYLSHVPFGGRIIGLGEVLIQNEFLRIAFIFLSLSFSLLFAWLFYQWIEKPSLMLSKKIKYKKTNSS